LVKHSAARAYFDPYFSTKTSIAASAAALVGAPWISRKSAFMARCTDFGTLLSTLPVLWSQQRWCRVPG